MSAWRAGPCFGLIVFLACAPESADDEMEAPNVERESRVELPAPSILFPPYVEAGTLSVPIRFTAPDEAMAGAKLVITIDRPSAGTMSGLSSQVFVREVDETFYRINNIGLFRPCLPDAADCLGPFVLSVALADRPDEPIAHVESEIVAPSGLPSAAPCLGGGNVAHGTKGLRTFILRGCVHYHADNPVVPSPFD